MTADEIMGDLRARFPLRRCRVRLRPPRTEGDAQRGEVVGHLVMFERNNPPGGLLVTWDGHGAWVYLYPASELVIEEPTP